MTKQEKHKLISSAYTTMEKNGETIHILNTEKLDMATQNALLRMQESLDAGFDLSYEIMAEACEIIADKTIDGAGRDSLAGDDLDFYADADSRANVYTAVQLSYLGINNEDEISELMKDEAITSIAQACSIWENGTGCRFFVVSVCEADGLRAPASCSQPIYPKTTQPSKSNRRGAVSGITGIHAIYRQIGAVR